MDGLEERVGVFVIAATNRPDIIDPAMLRPGRLDKLLYVPLPTPDDRLQIMKTVTRKVPLGEDIDLDEIAKDPACQGYSGADLSALVREAQLNALRMAIKSEKTEGIKISQSDFKEALTKVFPSVSQKDERIYKSLQSSLRKTRAAIVEEKVTEKPKDTN
jgi:ribosome biogenesis ATPase